MNWKRILLVAIALEILKVAFLLLAIDSLPETTSEFINMVFAMALWLLILPEMLVSHEQGPHGIVARMVMFSAGTVVNFILVGIVVSIWKSRKAKC